MVVKLRVVEVEASSLRTAMSPSSSSSSETSFVCWTVASRTIVRSCQGECPTAVLGSVPSLAVEAFRQMSTRFFYQLCFDGEFSFTFLMDVEIQMDDAY